MTNIGLGLARLANPRRQHEGGLSFLASRKAGGVIFAGESLEWPAFSQIDKSGLISRRQDSQELKYSGVLTA